MKTKQFSIGIFYGLSLGYDKNVIVVNKNKYIIRSFNILFLKFGFAETMPFNGGVGKILGIQYEKKNNVVEKAIKLSKKMHNGQKYGDTLPYTYHLEHVVKILKSFGFSDDKYIASAYLHDILEDTTMTYGELVDMFGITIASIVESVTDEDGKNRKEKKEKTLKKTANNPDGIILKVADRLSNVINSIELSNDKKLKMYKKEHNQFKKMLYIDSLDDMFVQLDYLLK